MTDSVQTAITFKDYFPLIGVVLGGVLAVSGGYFSNHILERNRRKSESKNLAFAFKGELKALSAIANKRGYVKHISNMIKRMQDNGKPLFVLINVRREYFNVYKSNVNNIGMLPAPLPELIARYYIQANSILEDLESYRDGSWASAGVDDLIASKTELVELMEDTFSLGDSIAEKIDEIYS